MNQQNLKFHHPQLFHQRDLKDFTLETPTEEKVAFVLNPNITLPVVEVDNRLLNEKSIEEQLTSTIVHRDEVLNFKTETEEDGFLVRNPNESTPGERLDQFQIEMAHHAAQQ